MFTYLVCIAQKHTRVPQAFCEVKLKTFHLSDLIKKAEKATDIKIDGYSNYIEWIEL